MKQKFIRKADIILILVIALAAAVIFLPKYISGKNANSITAEIMQNNKVVKTVDLSSVKKAYEINLDSDPAVIIKVEPGCIYYSHSDCHDQICVRTGRLTKVGDTAACVPSRTLIKLVSGKKDASAPDILTY